MPAVKRKEPSTGTWKAVEVEDESFLDAFNSGGGLTIEELDPADYEAFLAPRKKLKQVVDSSDAPVPKTKPTKTPKEPKQPKEPKEPKTVKISESTKTTTTSATTTVEAAAAMPDLTDKEILSAMSAWSELNVCIPILRRLHALNFLEPTPVQAETVGPALASSKDVVAASATGSGKTLAFAIPVVQKIMTTGKGIKALFILPTRELAVQVKRHIEAILAPGCGIKPVLAVGGMAVEKQLRLLATLPAIVIGTPGRLASLLGLVKPSNPAAGQPASTPQPTSTPLIESLGGIDFLVIDEADRLTEEGHFRDLKVVLFALYKAKSNSSSTSLTTGSSSTPLQTFVFSATLDISLIDKALKLQSLDQRVIVDVVNTPITLSSSTTLTTTPTTLTTTTTGKKVASMPSQLQFAKALVTEEKHREPTLLLLLRLHFAQVAAGGLAGSCGAPSRVLIFVNAITYVYRLQAVFGMALGPEYRVVGLHSGLKQKERLKKMEQFMKAERGVMVSTDLAARGLDMSAIDVVVHLQPPREAAVLVHRSGRTARAGKQGKCVMVVQAKEVGAWKKVFKAGTGREMEEVETMMFNSKDVIHTREILDLVNDVEKKMHAERKKNKEDAWMEKNAELIGVELSDDGADDDDDGKGLWEKEKRKEKVHKLNYMRDLPLPSLGNIRI